MRSVRIRFFLALTGFPQLGGHGLHIAHMLWGGLFMLASLVALLAFLGRRVQRIAAIVGGIGFGTFIDELGKFITSDNDYFFRPTISLIYCIFVLLFLLGRRIEERAPFSRRELVANGLDQIKESVLADGAPLPQRETQLNAELLRLLRSLGARDPAVSGLVAALQRLDAAPTRPATALERVAAGVDARYRRLIRSPRFATFVLTGLIAYALLTLVLLVVALVAATRPRRGDVDLRRGWPCRDRSSVRHADRGRRGRLAVIAGGGISLVPVWDRGGAPAGAGVFVLPSPIRRDPRAGAELGGPGDAELWIAAGESPA